MTINYISVCFETLCLFVSNLFSVLITCSRIRTLPQLKTAYTVTMKDLTFLKWWFQMSKVMGYTRIDSSKRKPVKYVIGIVYLVAIHSFSSICFLQDIRVISKNNSVMALLYLIRISKVLTKITILHSSLFSVTDWKIVSEISELIFKEPQELKTFVYATKYILMHSVLLSVYIADFLFLTSKGTFMAISWYFSGYQFLFGAFLFKEFTEFYARKLNRLGTSFQEKISTRNSELFIDFEIEIFNARKKFEKCYVVINHWNHIFGRQVLCCFFVSMIRGLLVFAISLDGNYTEYLFDVVHMVLHVLVSISSWF